MSRFVCLVWMVSFVASGVVHAADPERGAALYANQCTTCHTSTVHVREGRKAKDREDLRGWVARWRRHLALDWTADEVDDVVAYLARDVYRFPAGGAQ